ncbi:hypothetical protein PtB15_7B166 [Puccinia triticina]|nr:hypothetical protein PtB15_7B166 [Puccinia triticina]
MARDDIDSNSSLDKTARGQAAPPPQVRPERAPYPRYHRSPRPRLPLQETTHHQSPSPSHSKPSPPSRRPAAPTPSPKFNTNTGKALPTPPRQSVQAPGATFENTPELTAANHHEPGSRDRRTHHGWSANILSPQLQRHGPVPHPHA